MNKITLDATLQARLNGMREELELCDASGRTLKEWRQITGMS